MDLSPLATLKDKLLHAKTFADVQTYFLDHFGDQPEFMDLGERHRDPFLEAVFASVAEQLHNRRVPVTNVMLKRLPEHGFVHGSALLGGRLATMLYFEEPRRGLISVIWSVSPPETKFARFFGQLLPRHGRPSAN